MLDTFRQTQQPQQPPQPQQPLPQPHNQQARFSSAHTPAQFAKALLLANAAVGVVSLLVNAYAATSPAPSVSLGEENINAAELMMGFAALAQLLVYLVTIVAFIVWLHRSYKNVRAFGAQTEHTPGWAIGSWFVPFLNLIRPYQIVRETWAKSDPGVNVSAGYADAGPGARSATLVGAWWTAWIVSNVVDNVHGRLIGDAMTPDQMSSASTLGVVSSALTMAAAALAVLVVRTIDRMQEEKAARLSVSAWPAPPPPPTSFGPPAARA